MRQTPMEQGPEQRVHSFVSELAALDPEGLTEAERVAVVGALESLKGSAAAAQARVTAAAIQDREELGEDSRSVRAELALARRCSPTTQDRHVGVAKALTSEMPSTLAALTDGVISERRAEIVVRATACLTREDREEVDRRLAPLLPSSGDKALAGAAHRIAAELDNESLARRQRQAVSSRHLSVRPAADGMAWLSILGPMKEVVGAHAALLAEERRRHQIDPTLPEDEWTAAAEHARADQRGKGAWICDRALELLSGRAPGQPQPVTINLVMTDRTLLPTAFGGPAPADDVAMVPGWGPIAGDDARSHLPSLLEPPTSEDCASPEFVWLRRLFTDPSGRDLVAMDSVRRKFDGGLRTFMQLRDPLCRVPWCDAPALHIDHARSAARGGATSAANGDGLCERHNQVKEEPGWQFAITDTGLAGSGPHRLQITTPTRLQLESSAPPILGLGWTAPDPPLEAFMAAMDDPDPPFPPFPDGWIPTGPGPLPDDAGFAFEDSHDPEEPSWLDDPLYATPAA